MKPSPAQKALIKNMERYIAPRFNGTTMDEADDWILKHYALYHNSPDRRVASLVEIAKHL